MLFCPKCGVKVSKESEFCHKCGQELVMPDKKEEIIPDKESGPSSATIIDIKEGDPPKIYAKSKLITSLCVIGLFPFLMNIHMVIAACLLIGGIIGVLTHRVKDLGARKLLFAVVGLPGAVSAIIGIWSLDSVFEIIILWLAVILFTLPFRLGSNK